MKFRILITESYEKRANKFFKKHRNLVSQYEKVLRLLVLNPFHKSLRLHKIDSNSRENIYSISINMIYRIMIEFIIKEKEIILVSI